MKLLKQYFTVVQFIMLYKMVLTFALVDESQNVTIEMKATDRELRVGWGGGGGLRGDGWRRLSVLYKFILTFESLDENPKRNSYRTVHFLVSVSGALQFPTDSSSES